MSAREQSEQEAEHEAAAPEGALPPLDVHGESPEAEAVIAEAEPVVAQPGDESHIDAEPAGDGVAEPVDEADLLERAGKADAYLQLAQRTRADFDNYRKRMAREVRAAEARGIGKLARELLPALDNLELALQAVETSDPEHHLSAGIRLVTAELSAGLEV